MFKRTKQLIKANTLLKEELVRLENKYEEREHEAYDMNRLLSEINTGYLLWKTVEDEEGRVTDLLLEYANDVMKENSRIQGKEIQNQSINKILPNLSKNLRKIGNDAMISGNQTSFIHYDKIEDHYIKVICYKAGENRCASVFVDITDSFYAEKLLTEREEQYRSIFEVTDQYLFELDLDGKFCYISEGIRKMLGFEPEEYLGRYYYEQFPVDARNHLAHLFQKSFAECGQEIHGLIMELIGKDGREHYAIQNGIVLMDEDGKDIGYRGVYIDVTSLQTARKKAEEESGRKTEILTRMGREIHAPLNGMIGLVSLALEEPRTYKVYRYLHKMEENVVDLLDVINTVLEYSKIDEQEIKLYEEAFSLQLVIDKVTSLLSIKAEEKKIKLIVEMEKHVPDTYSGDSIRLGQILGNLLSSAIKYTEKGYVKLIIRKRDKGLLFIIKDTGMGMSREEIQHVFSPYDKENEEKAGPKRGTGVLMLISKQLIEAMDGRIKVFSKENEGTKIYVALPFRQCEEDLARATEHGYLAKRKLTQYEGNVLVVEDTAATEGSLHDMLCEMGMKVTAVGDGKEAIRLVKKSSYDLIFLDVFLPKISGFEISRSIRESGVETPIIAMTANPYETIKTEFEKAKMDDYLTKPVNRFRLEYMLQKYLRLEESDELMACTLEPVGHIDYAKAMEQVDHDHNLYNKIVFSFIKEYQEGTSRFKELTKEDHKAARIYIQKMKGAASALGAMELSALAGQLYEMLLYGKEDKGLVGMFTSELSAVLGELLPYAESITMNQYTKGFVGEKAEEVILELKGLLQSRSAAVVDKVGAIYETLYRSDIARDVEDLVSQIEEYDFDKAEKTLVTIRESLGVRL